MSYFDHEKPRLINKFTEDTLREGNIIRWKSNNSVPPSDVFDVWLEAGLISQEQYDENTVVRDKETAVFFAEYRKRMENYVPSPEEMYEMRAAFGTGETVVNVITGQKIQL